MDAPWDETLSHHEAHEGHEGFGYFDYKLRALRVLRDQIFFSVAARRNTFFVVKNNQIGASICHGFGARNLKHSTQTVVTIPGHSQ